MLTANSSVKELLRRGVAERGILAIAVVERLDVIESVGNGLGFRFVAGAMHPLILEVVEEACHRRIVPAVPLAAHRLDHSVFLGQRLKGAAGILASTVGVMCQTWHRLRAEPRHRQRIDHDVCRYPRFERPTDDSTVEQIKRQGEIQPTFCCPDLIGRTWREVPVEQVRCYRKTVLRIGRRLEAPCVLSADFVLTHQPLDTLLAGREAPVADFLRHSRAAVGPLELGTDGPDQPQHLHVRQPLAVRRAALLPCLVAVEARVQCRAHRWQQVGVALPVNPGVLHSASFAKYVVALFSISHSILSRAFSTPKRDCSTCSVVTTFAPGGLSFSFSAAFTQLRRTRLD